MTLVKFRIIVIIVHFSFKVAKLQRMRRLSRELLLDILDAIAERMSDGGLCLDLSFTNLNDWSTP